MNRKLRLTLLAGAVLLTGCRGGDADTSSAAEPVAVTTEKAVGIQHAPLSFFVGRIEAMESAQLTPRATGHLKEKFFPDGSLVKQGDVLYQIDPTPYEAALDSAIAALNEAEVARDLTELNHKRNSNLRDTGGISQSQLDLSEAELQMAQSRVSSARASLVIAQDNLDQTRVRAPYDGQTGKSRFSVGDMVGPDFGPITDIVLLHPIEATFSLKEEELAQHQLTGELVSNVSLELNGEFSSKVGEVSFIDNKINPSSGTIEVSARFDNQQALLTPNQFVRVGLSPAVPVDGVKVPHLAIQQDQRSQYVITIEDGTAARRDVTVLDRIGQSVFVSDGLKAGEPVIVGGLQRIRVGVPVVAAPPAKGEG